MHWRRGGLTSQGCDYLKNVGKAITGIGAIRGVVTSSLTIADWFDKRSTNETTAAQTQAITAGAAAPTAVVAPASPPPSAKPTAGPPPTAALAASPTAARPNAPTATAVPKPAREAPNKSDDD